MHRLTQYSQNNVKYKERWYVPLFLKSVPYLYLFLLTWRIQRCHLCRYFELLLLEGPCITMSDLLLM